MYKKIISVLLILSAVCSLFTAVSADTGGQASVDVTKLERKAYIHASKSDPSENPESYTNIYMPAKMLMFMRQLMRRTRAGKMRTAALTNRNINIT